MKRLIGAALLAGALALTAAPAFAQIYETTPWHGRIGFGAAEPIGDSEKIADTGWNFTGGFAYEPIDKKLGVRVDFLWSWMDLNNDIQTALGGNGGGAGINYMTVSAVLSSNRQRNLSFYAFGGGGLYKNWVHVEQIDAATGCYWDPWYGYICVPTDVTTFHESEVNWGTGIGGGMNLALGTGSGGFYVEASYHSVYGDKGNAEFVPVVLGFRW
jgi:hypothetical protein